MVNKKISVCIPVFSSEPYLENCLKSVAEQTFKDFEVVIVNDGSKGVDLEGNSCKQIIKKVKKSFKLKINYIEHSENKGLLEARRTAVYAAKGEYIFILDSDDKIPPDCFELLYSKVLETGADIVHGSAKLFKANGNEEKVQYSEEILKKARERKLKKITNVYQGTLENKDILRGFLVDHNHCNFLWGKLYKRELYLDAFNRIPPMFCTMAEDIIQYFWLAYYAKKYVGINNCIYSYCDDTGVTSSKVIDNLAKWEQVCSVSSVFTAIYTTIKEYKIELDQEEKKSISSLCCFYVGNNLQHLEAVVPELREQAYDLVCDFWGKEFVENVKAEYIRRQL